MKSLGAMGRGPGHEHKVVPANMQHLSVNEMCLGCCLFCRLSCAAAEGPYRGRRGAAYRGRRVAEQITS